MRWFRCAERNQHIICTQLILQDFLLGTDIASHVRGGSDMKARLVALLFVAGVSAFAQTRFSVQVGGYSPGYGYAPGYYAPAQGNYYRPYSAYGYGSDYWRMRRQREHERAEKRALRNHQREERYYYRDSNALREHQEQERWELNHEQWHERNGDRDARFGPGHDSAREGRYEHQHEH